MFRIAVSYTDVSFIPCEQAEILSTKELHKNIVNWETLLVSRKILFCTLLQPDIKAVKQLFQALAFLHSTLNSKRKHTQNREIF